jgi:hypothetical protein
MIRDIFSRPLAGAACSWRRRAHHGALGDPGWHRPQDVSDWLAAAAMATVIALAVTAAWIFGGLALSPGWQAAAELAAGCAGPRVQEAP